MNGISFKLPRLLLPLGLLSLGVSLLATPILWYQEVQQGPDSTKTSKLQATLTADQQQMTPADRALTQKIRKAIHILGPRAGTWSAVTPWHSYVWLAEQELAAFARLASDLPSSVYLMLKVAPNIDDGWSPERLPTLSRTLGRRRFRLRLNCC
jgi:hypothetical protein